GGAGGVGADVVAQDQVARAGVQHVHAVGAVAGDDVAGAGHGAADGAGLVRGQENALLLVPYLRAAVAAQADVVALDLGGAVVIAEDARAAVARDDVARVRGRAADGRRGVGDPDAVAGVAQRRGPRGADHADVVSLDECTGAFRGDGDAVPLVAGDDVGRRDSG